MRALNRFLAPLNLGVWEQRRESAARAAEIVRDELMSKREYQATIVIHATDPDIRARAQDEIERINCLLRAT